MSEQSCIILKFFTLVEGSWRNAVFIDPCAPAACREGAPCEGYLFTADTDGCPVLIPASLFRRLTGEPVDPSECSGRLSCLTFMQLYRRRLLWLTPSDVCCGTRAMASTQPPPPCGNQIGGSP